MSAQGHACRRPARGALVGGVQGRNPRDLALAFRLPEGVQNVGHGPCLWPLPDPGGEPGLVGAPHGPLQEDRGLAADHAVGLERAGLLERRRRASTGPGRRAGRRSTGRPAPSARAMRCRSQSAAGPRAPRRTGSAPGGGRQRTTKAPSQKGSTSASGAVTTRLAEAERCLRRREPAEDGVAPLAAGARQLERGRKVEPAELLPGRRPPPGTRAPPDGGPSQSGWRPPP